MIFIVWHSTCDVVEFSEHNGLLLAVIGCYSLNAILPMCFGHVTAALFIITISMKFLVEMKLNFWPTQIFDCLMNSTSISNEINYVFYNDAIETKQTEINTKKHCKLKFHLLFRLICAIKTKRCRWINEGITIHLTFL